MPIYEYNCGKCGKSFEVLLKTAKDAPGKCPKCGAADIKKQFSAFAVAAGSAAVSHGNENCPTCPSAGTGCGGMCGI